MSEKLEVEAQNAEELEAIEAIQDALAVIKKNLRKVEKINLKAGRHLASNEAYGWRMAVGSMHSKMFKSMGVFFPSFIAPIGNRGGGGR